MIIASIDIGSNTVILLIAEYFQGNFGLIPKLILYETPRISTNLNRNNKISDDSYAKLDKVFQKYFAKIKEFRSDQIIIKATNAFRVSKNGTLIKQLLENKYKCIIQIISGEEEASLSYLGVVIPNYLNQEVAIIDIGGGSTEIIYGVNQSKKFIKSFPIGIISLFEKFVVTNPPSKIEIRNIELYVEKALSNINEYIPNNTKLIAIAGTPTTLACIKNKMKYYSETEIENQTLTLNDLLDFEKELSKLTSEQIMNKYNTIVKGREDVLLVGTIILKFILKKLNAVEIIISSKGLKEGSIWDYLFKINLLTMEKILAKKPTK